MLHSIDWFIILGYLVVVFAVGLIVSRKASTGAESYFLADRDLPWWWAGISMAATTFAADTPLAVTGIIASRGLSGNWMWISWIFLHLAMVFVFAKSWRKSRALTDAEIISLRYSGKAASWLRSIKAFFYGVVFNAIVLGWVLKAMNKIVAPFFHWNEWTPNLVEFVANWTPSFLSFGTPEEMISSAALLMLVAIYSSAGGFRGVVLTDLFQFSFAIGASYYLASLAYTEVGGFGGLMSSYRDIYGNTEFLSIIPSAETSWIKNTGLGIGLFAIYIMVQSYANNPADGGGYFMQRLGACKDEKHASKAALLFVSIHYFIRVWPWFFMGIAALVIIPIGMEGEVFSGQYALVAGDRESAYPALMNILLSEGSLGIMLASLLAAFMSTIDTHLNWGASYIVNDFYSVKRPKASDRSKVRVARLSVFAYMLLALFVASKIDAISEAWQWLAYIGAGIGVPTILRWLWWRVSAWSEILSLISSIVLALILWPTELSFELRLIIIGLGGLLSTFAGFFLGDRSYPKSFEDQVAPMGAWKGRPGGKRELGLSVGKVIGLFVIYFSVLSMAGKIIFPH